MMEEGSLRSLTDSVSILLKDSGIAEIIRRLNERIELIEEPFTWEILDAPSLPVELPAGLKSAWVFVLKRNTPSIAHYHPNSIQYTVMVEGSAKVKIAKGERNMKLFDPMDAMNQDAWCVIDKSTAHEFFPGDEHVVVISFHSSTHGDLLEIQCGSGEQRSYV
jgi:hypothetical protein